MVTYTFYRIIIPYILSFLIKKKLTDGKKGIGESVQKTVLWNANYDRENNEYTNTLRPRCFMIFQQISYDVFHKLDTFYLSGFIPSITLIYYSSICRKTELGPIIITRRVISSSRGINWIRLTRHISLARMVTYHLCVFRNSDW